MKATIFLFGTLLSYNQISAYSGNFIPVTHAESLTGSIINLPTDLNGKLAILLLGFTQKSSLQTKHWADAIRRSHA